MERKNNLFGTGMFKDCKKFIMRAVLISLGLAAAVIVFFFYAQSALTDEVDKDFEPVCGIEEHVHDDSCYEKIRICGFEDADIIEDTDITEEETSEFVESFVETSEEETEEASEDENIAEEITEEEETQPVHVHTDDCYIINYDNLICGIEEHTHDKDCYPVYYNNTSINNQNNEPENNQNTTEYYKVSNPTETYEYNNEPLTSRQTDTSEENQITNETDKTEETKENSLNTITTEPQTEDTSPKLPIKSPIAPMLAPLPTEPTEATEPTEQQEPEKSPENVVETEPENEPETAAQNNPEETEPENSEEPPPEKSFMGFAPSAAIITTYSFSFIKVDAYTFAPLANAKFELYKDGTPSIKTFATSDSAGIVNFTGLNSLGIYYMNEINEPAGYKPNETIYKIELTSDTGIDVNLTITSLEDDGSVILKDNNYQIKNIKIPSPLPNEITLYKTVNGQPITEWYNSDDFDFEFDEILDSMTFELYKVECKGDKNLKELVAENIKIENDGKGKIVFDKPNEEGWYAIKEIITGKSAEIFEPRELVYIYVNEYGIMNSINESNVDGKFTIHWKDGYAYYLKLVYSDGCEFTGPNKPAKLDGSPSSGQSFTTEFFETKMYDGTMVFSLCADIGAEQVYGDYDLDDLNHEFTTEQIFYLISAFDYINGLYNMQDRSTHGRALAQVVLWNTILQVTGNTGFVDKWVHPACGNPDCTSTASHIIKVEGLDYWYAPYKDMVDHILAHPEYYIELYKAKIASGPAEMDYVTGAVFIKGDGQQYEAIYQQRQLIVMFGKSVVFDNKEKMGTLNLTKSLEGTGADYNKDFTFTVTFTGGRRINQIKSSNQEIYPNNGVWTFTLKGSKSISFTNIPAGTTYIITENETYPDYKLISITNEGTGKFTYNNINQIAYITATNKHTDGPRLPDTGGSTAKPFIITGTCITICTAGAVLYLRKKKEYDEIYF